MNKEDKQSLYPIVRLISALTMMTVAISGMYAAVMVLEPVTTEFNIGRGAGALPYTLFMVGFGMSNIAMGWAADRYGIAAVAALGSICLPFGLYVASETQTLLMFCLVMSLFCGFLGTGFSFGPLVADISHWFTERRGLAVGIVISGSYVGGAIWPPLLQHWIDLSGWRESFVNLAWVCGVMMMPLTLVLTRRPQIVDNRDNISEDDRRRPLGFSRSQLQSCICLAGVGCCVAMAMPQVHIVPYVVDLGFEPLHGAKMLGLMLGFGVISRVLSGWLSDRLGGIKTLIIGSGLQCLVIVAFMFSHTLIALYLVSIAFGLAQGGIVPSYSIIIRRYFPANEAGRRIGLAFVFTIGGMALGGWMAGFLYDLTGSYTVSYLNAIAFNIMNMGLALLFLSRRRKFSTAVT